MTIWFQRFIFGLSVAMLLMPLVTIAGPDIGINPGGLAGQIAGKSGYETAGVDQFTLSQSIGRVIKIVLSLVGMIFMVLTIYAGILWMTASGNEEQVTNATNIIKRATLGLVIVIAGYGLTVFIVLGVTSATGVQGTQIGGAGVGAGGFWQSFGTQFKDHWSSYVFP